MKFLVKRSVVVLFFFFLATIISRVAFAGVSIELKGLQIEQTQNGFLVKGIVVGSGLNTPIPEKDTVEILAEIKKGPNAKYPKLPQYYSIAAGCPQIAGKCLTPEEEKGVNIASVGVASIILRPGPVWRLYGGLGKWEKRAPDRVEKPFQGYIPLQYAGKKARIHVTLTHVIGGPYAAWPGISYYHAVKEVVLPAVQGQNSGKTSGGSGKTSENTKMYEILEVKKDLGWCRRRVRSQERLIRDLKERKKQVDLNSMGIGGGSGYHSILEDIQRMRRLHKAGANYKLVLECLDPVRESNRLREQIRLEEDALYWEKVKCRQLEEKLRKLEGK
ncbi:hypothetical protein [Thermodesulfatator autotrophicus]|uniref:Uncharacterized protein n=1 Tax=Thermodesulfatator autotrophicus TaxID=1795632 RepID=A0A177E709_9BACT|nr:hypothetical protein [Thermodesulfatator autotrophicus]OAG27281.1 hypothetical protein TH606_07690 [Thermodesulfatator autotrophicus]